MRSLLLIASMFAGGLCGSALGQPALVPGTFADAIAVGYAIGRPNPHGEIIIRIVDPAAAARIAFADLTGWLYCHQPHPWKVAYFLVDQNNVLQSPPQKTAMSEPQTCAALDQAVGSTR